MCGRFTQHYSWQQVHQFLSVIGAPQNCSRTTTLRQILSSTWCAMTPMAIVSSCASTVLCQLGGKRPLKDLPATFNARIETVADKPVLRDAYCRRRCVGPASGFYEWTGKGDKQPHISVDAAGAPILAVAGLWDRWRDPQSGEEILSCTIILTEATQWMTPYHDRMRCFCNKRRSLALGRYAGRRAASGGRKCVARMANRSAPQPHRLRRRSSRRPGTQASSWNLKKSSPAKQHGEP